MEDLNIRLYKYFVGECSLFGLSPLDRSFLLFLKKNIGGEQLEIPHAFRVCTEFEFTKLTTINCPYSGKVYPVMMKFSGKGIGEKTTVKLDETSETPHLYADIKLYGLNNETYLNKHEN